MNPGVRRKEDKGVHLSLRLQLEVTRPADKLTRLRRATGGAEHHDPSPQRPQRHRESGRSLRPQERAVARAALPPRDSRTLPQTGMLCNCSGRNGQSGESSQVLRRTEQCGPGRHLLRCVCYKGPLWPPQWRVPLMPCWGRCENYHQNPASYHLLLMRHIILFVNRRVNRS